MRPVFDQLMDTGQQGHLTGGRQRRLRFIEDIQAVSLQAVQRERQKALAVGLVVERFPSVSFFDERGGRRLAVQLLDIAGHIIKTLGSQEKTILRRQTFGETQIPMQLRMRCV